MRRLLHAMGFRYRLHRKDLPGKPDLVFLQRKKVIMVHGCFWHRHSSVSCNNGRLPKSRLDYWLPKLQRNVIRDQENTDKLLLLGWDQLVIWECQVKKHNLPNLCEEIRHFLNQDSS